MNQVSEPSSAEPLFSRPYSVDEISTKGVKGLVEARENERAQIATALDLAGLDSLRLNFQLSRVGKQRFKLSGNLEASATQTCVVTLMPVAVGIDEKIEAEFWPPEDVALVETETEPENMFVPLEGPEPICDGVLDIGQIAYEYFAASLDPYPKVEGACFDWNNQMVEDDDVSRDRPFAALARLKGQAATKPDQAE